MSKIVHLVTTKGCAACEIMENILHKIQDAHPDSFELKVIDVTKVPAELKSIGGLNDFPTTFISEDDMPISKITGTKSIKYITQVLEIINFI